jgi:hypothetical protein
MRKRLLNPQVLNPQALLALPLSPKEQSAELARQRYAAANTTSDELNTTNQEGDDLKQGTEEATLPTPFKNPEANALHQQALMRATYIKEHQDMRGRRWYDPVACLADAVDFMKFAPRPMQLLFANHIDEQFDHYKNRAKNRNQGANSIGVQRLYEVYHAQFQQRWQDQDPVLRRMFVLMSTLPEKFLTEFATRVLFAGELCQNANLKGHHPDMKRIEQQLKKAYPVLVEAR